MPSPAPSAANATVFEARGLRKVYHTGELDVVALHGVDLCLQSGELVVLLGASVYDAPLHPYTEALLSSVPIPDPPLQRARQRIVLRGEVPNPVDPPPGCRFQSRCPVAEARCASETPVFEEKAPGHWVACHLR